MNIKSLFALAAIILIITPSTAVLAESVAEETVTIPALYFQRFDFAIDQDNTPLTTTVTVNEGNGVDLFILSNLWQVPDPSWVNFLGARQAPFQNETFYALNGTTELVRAPNLLDNVAEFGSHNITIENSAEFTIELDEGPYWLYLWNHDFDFIVGSPANTDSCSTLVHPVFDCMVRYGAPTTVTIQSEIDNPTSFVTLFIFLGGFIAIIVFVIWRVKKALTSTS